MEALRVVRPPFSEVGHINNLLRTGDELLPRTFLIAFSGVYQPWFIAPDKRLIAFARWQCGAIEEIVVFEAGNDQGLASNSTGWLFKLAEGEGWMRDPSRCSARLRHIRRAIVAANTTLHCA